MTWQIIFIIYYIICNLTLFILFGVDKRKAVRHKQRISEKCLLIWGAIGGAIGGLLGMNIFHHKTKKFYFWLILLLSVGGHLYLWIRFLL